MTVQATPHLRRLDSFVNWLMLGVFVLALALGWAVKTSAENRTVAFDQSGLRVRYPEGWVRVEAQPPALFHVEDRTAAGYRSSLTIEMRPAPTGLKDPLAAVQQSIALDRGSRWTAFRVLRVENNASMFGRSGTHVTFAFVETHPNPFLETVPVVMEGEDLLVANDDQVYVFTLTAAEPNFARTRAALRSLVQSWLP